MSVSRPLERLPELPQPWEFLKLGDGECVEFRIVRWQLFKAVIHPTWPGAPEEKVIRVLRVWVDPKDKPIGPDYYDISSSTLVYQLMGFLSRPDFNRFRVRICAHGIPPRKRYSVEFKPARPA